MLSLQGLVLSYPGGYRSQISLRSLLILHTHARRPLCHPLQATYSPLAAPSLFGELLRRPPAERNHLQEALLVRAPPQPGAAAAGKNNAYTSPLLSFRSYR